ncbi:UPF0314 protein, partial [Dissostichus eleginoides]
GRRLPLARALRTFLGPWGLLCLVAEAHPVRLLAATVGSSANSQHLHHQYRLPSVHHQFVFTCRLGSQSERFTGNMRKLVSTITTLSSFLNVSIQITSLSLEIWEKSLLRKKAARKGKVAEEQGDVHVRCAAVLRALPNYLHEDDSTFLRLWHVEQSDDPDIDDVAVGLLLISARSTNATLFCPERIAVVLEGNRVIELPTLADAFILLFALIFTLYLSYPKDLANTLDFTQNVLMGLDEGNLRPR